MPFHECSYKPISGKSKGIPCGCTALSYDGITYCNRHYISAQKKKLTITVVNNATCCAILKSGKKSGSICGAKIKNKDHTVCGRHKQSVINTPPTT
jgi:hypothetical protein